MTQLIKKLLEPKAILLIGIIYSTLITVAFLSPTTNLPKINFTLMDKSIHVAIHWILCLIWLFYVHITDQYHTSSKNVFVILIACFFYGLLIEVSQHLFTQFRTFDVFDILANGIGDLMGLLTFWIVKKKIIR